MSARDYTENHVLLRALKGRRCSPTLAASTIKLHIDRNQKYGDYLWIDPPWNLTRHGEAILSSASYPDHEDENYEVLHRKWAQILSDLVVSEIQEISATSEGALTVELDNGSVLEAPTDNYRSDDADDWYDHWYVCIRTRTSEQAVPPKSDRAGG